MNIPAIDIEGFVHANDALHAYSPIAYGGSDDQQVWADLACKLHERSLGELADLQKQGLMPVLDVVSNMIRETPPPPDAKYIWTGQDMGQVFRLTARGARLLQLLQPAILPVYTNRGALEEAHGETLDQFGMKFGVVADSFGMPYIPSMVMNGPGSTHFGFINIVRNQRTNDHRIVSNLVSIPYVTVPKEILQVTKRLNAEPLLRDFQSIFALINHDWYHAMTPLIINPYYGNKGYELSETPYGVHFERREEKLIPRGRGSAVTTVINERHEGYVFSELDENGYESLGLIVQAEAFQRLYQNPSMQGYIDSRLEQFFKKVGQLGFDIRYMSITPRDEHKTLANQAQHYFSTLMMHHLLRVVPVDHPLFKKCEGWINDHCDIDKSFLKNDTFERVIRRSKKSTADISAVTGLQAPSPLKSTDLEEQVADHKDIQRRRNLKLPQKTAEPEVKRSSLLAPFIEIARDVRGGLKEMDFSVRVAASIPKLYRLTKKWTTAEHIRWAAWEQSFDHHGSIHTPSYLKFRESAPRAMQLLMDAVFDDWHKAVGQHQKPQPQPAH